MKKRKILLLSILIMGVLSGSYIQYHNMNSNDIGLKVLTWLKKIKGNAIDLDSIAQSDSPTIQHAEWTSLLERQVNATGQVNYKGFIKDSVLFEQYLNKLSTNPPGKNWSEAEQIAYWINAYNAFTVKLIVDHYPLKSIKDISDGLPMINSPWDIKFFKIGEADFDLNTIEHEILRKQFTEPRIHFAINCASFSCPKLRNEAFTASQLERQLEEQARGFIHNSDKNRIDGNTTQISKIFNWFQSDFEKQTDILSYIQNYQPDLNKKNKIEYLEYNWTLNEQ